MVDPSGGCGGCNGCNGCAAGWEAAKYVCPGSDIAGAAEGSVDGATIYICKAYRDMLLERFDGDEKACCADPKCKKLHDLCKTAQGVIDS